MPSRAKNARFRAAAPPEPVCKSGKQSFQNHTEHRMRQKLLGPLPILLKRKQSRIAAALLFAFAALTCGSGLLAANPAPTPTPTAFPTPSPVPSPSPWPCHLRVLIVYADYAPPTMLKSQILAEPGVTAVDLFDASYGLGD